MVTLQAMPEAITSFLAQHHLASSVAYADEPPAAVQRALGPVVELVLRGFAELAGQADGRETVWNAAREAAAASPGQMPPSGTGLIKTVLDDRYHGTVNTVAKEAGLSTPTVSSLLEAATGAALHLMGGLVAEQHWSATQLGEWLRPRQFAPVAAPLPTAAVAAAPAARGAASWFAAPANIMLLVVSTIALGELGYILSTRPEASAPAVAVATTSAPATGQYTAIPVANIAVPRTKAAVPVVLKLKDGVRQIIGASSTESKLYQFLIDPTKEVDEIDPTKGWIGFDRIYFDTSKATLTNESLWQLSNVASILKRFPAAKIKIGGYTDNSGNPLNNLKLSAERAKAAKEALVSLGVPVSRLTSTGYGIVDNIASNDTEEGRALNRRVSMQVIQK
ncbi:MAG: OmpA family protein [Hymenobacter sp.]|nr:MAG: OmpA family protein [Hymenobacter sp.]